MGIRSSVISIYNRRIYKYSQLTGLNKSFCFYPTLDSEGTEECIGFKTFTFLQ